MFIVCVAAAVLVHRNGHPLLFGVAAFVAFANLFSSQLMCALDGCRFSENPRSWRDPSCIAFLVNRTTGVVGAMILVYALADLYMQDG